MQKILTSQGDLCITCTLLNYTPAEDRSYEQSAVSYSMTNTKTGESEVFDIEIVPGSMSNPHFSNFEFLWLGANQVTWKRQWFNGYYVAGPILGTLPRRSVREITYDLHKSEPIIMITDSVIEVVNSDDDFSYEMLGFTFHFDFKKDQLKIGKSIYDD